MKKVVLAFGTLLLPHVAWGDALVKGEQYRLLTDFTVKEKIPGSTTPVEHTVGKSSKFIVIGNENDTDYTVQFMNIYNKVSHQEMCFAECSWTDFNCADPVPKPSGGACPAKTTPKSNALVATDTTENRSYIISKDSVTGESIEDHAKKTTGGPTSGALVVPFKFRTKDDSLSGEATVGAYAGYGWDMPKLNYIVVTPFLSAGITQVSVSSVNDAGNVESTNKSGFTLAGGFLIQNWGGVNIGIVAGEDRIGDKAWEYEGDTWYSLSVGWKL